MSPQAFQPAKAAIVIFCFLLISSCTKHTNAVGQSESSLKSASPGNEVAAQPAFPRPNLSTPLTAYKQINNNNDLMFTYYALSDAAADYKRIMDNYSVEYWNTRDQFERQDLVDKFRPELDREIGARRDNRYIKLDIKATWKLRKYDFEKKGFPQTVLSSASRFGWDKAEWKNSQSIAESYFVEFSNGDDYQVLKVEDEKSARMIESKLAEELHLIVYGFIQSVDSKKPFLNMHVVSVTLVDGNGVQLL